MRRQRLPGVPADRAARADCVRRHRLQHDCRAPRLQPAVPGDHLQHRRLRGGERHQGARLLHQLPESRRLHPRHSAGDRLAGRVPRRRDGSGAHDGVRGEDRTSGAGSGEADRGAGARERNAAYDVARSTRGVHHRRVRVDGDQGRSRVHLPADADREGRQRKDDRGAAPDHRREHRASRPQQQPALHDPAEVLAAGGLPGAGADRRGARCEQQQGRQAGRLRPRHRGRLRVLHHSLFGPCWSVRGTPARQLCAVARQPRPRGGGHRAGRLARRLCGPADPVQRAALLAARRAGADGSRWGRRVGTGRSNRRGGEDSTPGLAASEPPGSLCLTTIPLDLPVVVRRAGRHLLHLDVDRSGRQAVRRRGAAGAAAPLFLLRDAAVRVLHHPDGRPGGDAGDDRPADQEQRADRDAGLRHQPVSLGAAAAALRDPLQRGAVRTAGAGARRFQPRSGPPERDYPRLSDAELRRPEPAVDHRPERRHLPLRVLRSADEPVQPVVDVSPERKQLEAGHADLRQGGGAHQARRRRR